VRDYDTFAADLNTLLELRRDVAMRSGSMARDVPMRVVRESRL
jgi:hypothetical protein